MLSFGECVTMCRPEPPGKLTAAKPTSWYQWLVIGEPTGHEHGVLMVQL